MERYFKEITSLAVDLELLLTNWKLNPHVTEAQRRLWPTSELSRTALGTDDPNCPRLLKEDGHDGEPVGSRDKASATKFFCSEDHLFPPERDLIRFAIFCHLGFFRALHLVVKSQWEELVINEKRQSLDIDSRVDYRNCLNRFEDGALARLLDRFRLGLDGRAGADEIFLLFEQHGNMATKLGYDRQRFSALIDQMIRSRVHYRGTASAELQAFAARQEREIALLSEAAQREEYEFWLKKCCWLAIQGELEDKLLLREDIRLKNFNVTMEWMALFGKVYVDLLDAQMLCHQLERRMAMRQADPSLSDEEIDRRVKECIEEELSSIEQVRREALHAASLGLLGPYAETMSNEEYECYREEARKIIREIWRLTHPDTLNRSFTERQRQKLREYLEQVVNIRREEALLDIRTISVLRDILTRVKEIYDVMGVDLEPESVIRGDTLADQIAWLETEIKKIERQIDELRAEIQAMTMDPDIREKMACMAGEEAQKATMLMLEQHRRELDEKLLALQAEYRHMLDEGETAKSVSL